MGYKNIAKYLRSSGPKIMADLSPSSRTHSFLLDPVNPVMNPKEFKQTRLPKQSMKGREPLTTTSERLPQDPTGAVTFEMNPYLRMLASQLRQCFYSKKLMPSDLLIRLGVAQVPNAVEPQAGSSLYLIPDGVEHRRFRSITTSKGVYAPCDKKAFKIAITSGKHKRHGNIAAHSLLTEHVSHQLRLRVLQELGLLAERLRHSPEGSDEFPTIQRLSASEWNHVQTTQTYNGDQSIVALLFPETQEINLPLSQDGMTGNLPVATLLRSKTSDSSSTAIPLFNCGLMFPSELPAVRDAMNRIIAMEERLRYKLEKKKMAGLPGELTTELPPVTTEKGMEKTSASLNKPRNQVYIVHVNEGVYRRADTAPLIIALWRLGKWEGGMGNGNNSIK